MIGLSVTSTIPRIATMPAVLHPAIPPADFQLKRFTVEEYDQMIRDGTIDGEPLELLDGWIVEKMPKNAPHDSAISRLNKRLNRLLGDEFLVRIQSSAVVDTSMPEPDVAVVFGPDDEFDNRRPNPSDLLLVIEVAESSLVRDRGFKARLYGRNKIPVYWIVNLKDRVVEVHSLPRNGKNAGYRNIAIYRPGDAVPVVIGKKTVGSIPVSEILP